MSGTWGKVTSLDAEFIQFNSGTILECHVTKRGLIFDCKHKFCLVWMGFFKLNKKGCVNQIKMFQCQKNRSYYCDPAVQNFIKLNLHRILMPNMGIKILCIPYDFK